MRIALVGDYPEDPNKINTGPQAVFVYLVDELRRCSDFELHVVTAHKSPAEEHTLHCDGFTVTYLQYPQLPVELYYPIMRRSIHRVLFRIRPDLIHGQSALLHGCIALGAGFPTVLSAHNVHGTEAQFETSKINQLRFHLHHSLMRRYFVAKVRHIVSINTYIRKSYEGVVNAKFYDIPNPVDNAFFNLDQDLEMPNNILFVGQLRTRKRPDLALEALAKARQKVPDLTLYFAGEATEPALKSQMDQYITNTNLGENIQFMGHLSEIKLHEAYQRASIVLLTSDLETSPMSIQQAMAAGKAVVATAVGGVPYLIDHGRTGLVIERGNSAHLAQALVYLAQNPGLKKCLGQDARRYALSHFLGETVSRQTHAMYHEINNTHLDVEN